MSKAATPTRFARRPADAAPKRVLVSIVAEHVVGRRILEGIADYADHHGRWQIFLDLAIHADPIRERHIDGIITAAELLQYPKFRRLMHRAPALRVTGPPADDGTPAVVVDNQAVGRMGANYLADLGLKHLAYVPYPSTFSDHRAMGFEQACRARRLSYTILTAEQAAASRLRRSIARLPDPVGIMVATDRKALEVSRVCRLIGRRIPEQVALLGVDNETEICRLVDPPLTSIDHGPRRIGYEAARLLDHWMTTGQRPQRSLVVQPVRVVARQSTDLLAIDDPDVVTAIRFIRSNFSEAIKVNDVLKHVAMSRRSLEMHFRAALGRTIHEEIMRVRVERAKQLLATSDWSMPQIAAECGFALASQFSYVFKRETGEAPSAYRSRHRYGLS